MPPSDLMYACAVLGLAYFIRGISGFGSGLIAVPLLALRFPLTAVVPFILLTDFVASSTLGGLNLARMDHAETRRLLPMSVVGVALGASLLVFVPETWLLGALSGFILLFGLRFLLIKPGPFRPISPAWAYPAALSGGAIGGTFGTGGPPYVVYLAHRIEDKSRLRATLSGLFFMEGLLRITAFLISGLLLSWGIWRNAALALPLIMLALYAGSHVHTRLSNLAMQRVVGALLLVSALSVGLKLALGA